MCRVVGYHNSNRFEYVTLAGWSSSVRIDQIEIMQYTGLKDKNGKEIYEGDIIEYKYDSGSTFIGELVFGDYLKQTSDMNCRIIGFYLRGIDIDGQDWYTDFPKVNHIEVIGNIYENPELLK